MNKPSLPDRAIPLLGPDGRVAESWYRWFQYVDKKPDA